MRHGVGGGERERECGEGMEGKRRGGGMEEREDIGGKEKGKIRGILLHV